MTAYPEQDQPDRLPDPGTCRWPPFEPAKAGDDEAWAILAYMTAAIVGFGPPLLIFLLKGRGSPDLRSHLAQAVNTAVTMFLYLICLLIVGGMLALDSATVAAAIAGPAAVLLWLIAAGYLIRAAVAASRGEFSLIPGWLCATIVRR